MSFKTLKIPLTERQLRAIFAISKSMGLNKDDIHNLSMKTFGSPPNELSKLDASNFIDNLQQIIVKNVS
jgi:hypothetical protein